MSVPNNIEIPYWDAAISLSIQKKERVRRYIIRLVFFTYWLLIFEGALRKWILPQFNELFFFIRVPFVFAIYWLAFKHRLWPRPRLPLLVAYGFAVAALILIPLQFFAGGYSARHLLIAGYGWHNYFFYIPLAFIIAEQFRAEDLKRLIHHTLMIAVMAAPLVILQFWSSPDSVVNLGSSLDEDNQFKNLGAALGFVRPTGFFTSTLGQQQFVITIIAMLLALWVQPRSQQAVNYTLLLIATVSAAVMLAFSGSRGLFMHVGILFLGALFSALILMRKQILVRAVAWPATLVILFVVLYPIIFPSSFEVFLMRWQGAYTSESEIFAYGIFGRAFYAFYSFIDYMSDTPLIGYLLGLGGNAAGQLPWVQFPQAALEWTGYGLWAEGGWPRHIIELGPALGLLFIIYRITLTVWLGSISIKASRKSGNLLPFFLFSYLSVILLMSQITGHGTVVGYCWLFVGFCLATCQITLQRSMGNKEV